MNRDRVEFANGLRGVAAFSVVISHYLGVYWFNREAVADLIKAPVLPDAQFATPAYLVPLQIHPLFNWGAFGVALFFVISGFVIPYSLRGATWRSFAISRAFRLLPTYVVGFSVTLVALAAAGVYFDRPWPFTVQEILIHYLPGLRDILHSRNVDGIIWTLEIEIKFYVLCAIFLPLFRRRSWTVFLVPALIVAAGLLLAAKMPIWAIERPALYNAISPFLFSAQYIVYMFAGTALHYAYIGRFSDRAAFSIAFALLIGFGLMWALCPLLVPFNLAWNYAFAFATFALAMSFQPSQLSNGAITFLASISYPLYVVHGVFGYVLLRILMDAGIPTLPTLALASVLVFSLAWALHHFIEEPGRLLGRGMGKSRLQAAPPVARPL